MFDEKTKTIILPDKRFVFLSNLLFLNNYRTVTFYDNQRDSKIDCERVSDKIYKIIKDWYSYELPFICRENNLYKVREPTCHSDYNNYNIFNYKLKSLGISYTIETKNDIHYITILDDIHRAMFELYFGQYVKLDFGED